MGVISLLYIVVYCVWILEWGEGTFNLTPTLYTYPPTQPSFIGVQHPIPSLPVSQIPTVCFVQSDSPTLLMIVKSDSPTLDDCPIRWSWALCMVVTMKREKRVLLFEEKIFWQKCTNKLIEYTDTFGIFKHRIEGMDCSWNVCHPVITCCTIVYLHFVLGSLIIILHASYLCMYYFGWIFLVTGSFL